MFIFVIIIMFFVQVWSCVHETLKECSTGAQAPFPCVDVAWKEWDDPRFACVLTLSFFPHAFVASLTADFIPVRYQGRWEVHRTSLPVYPEMTS